MALDNGPVQEFRLDEWLRNGVEDICHKFEARPKVLDVAGFRTHMRNARKERLLAVRSLIDRKIELLEKEQEAEKSTA